MHVLRRNNRWNKVVRAKYSKTRNSQVVHKWTALHEDFLDRLYKSTHQLITFEQSDYYRTLTDLQLHIEWLPQEVDVTLVTTVINRVLSQYQNRKWIFCLSCRFHSMEYVYGEQTIICIRLGICTAYLPSQVR